MSSLYVPTEAVATLAGYLRRLVQPCGKRQSSQDDPTDSPKLGASRAQRRVAGRPGPDVQQPDPGLDQLLRPVLQVGSLPDPATHRPYSGSMGASEIQVLATSSAANSALDRSRSAATTIAVRPLGAFCRDAAGQWEPDEARVSRPVLRARGGVIPLRDSPQHLRPQRTGRPAGHGEA